MVIKINHISVTADIVVAMSDHQCFRPQNSVEVWKLKYICKSGTIHYVCGMLFSALSTVEI